MLAWVLNLDFAGSGATAAAAAAPETYNQKRDRESWVTRWRRPLDLLVAVCSWI